MGKVQFEVSAKTARLIGRENISDVDGAIVELIKTHTMLMLHVYLCFLICLFLQSLRLSHMRQLIMFWK